MATEEKSELKNHVKWARFLVKNDGTNMPREITLLVEGSSTTSPIWLESKPRIDSSEVDGTQPLLQVLQETRKVFTSGQKTHPL